VVWYYQPIPKPVDQRQQLLTNISRVVASSYVSTLNSGMERRGILLDRLTPGQRRVARLMAKGHSKKQIAGDLERSEHTIHDHIKSIYSILSVRSRAEFMALWADA
jgi:DNA-binding NarL/FixJ family response regulator